MSNPNPESILRTNPVVSTGITEIDNRIGGGVPLGSLTLIEGDAHSGKSVFSQQLVWGSLRDGYRSALFTSENTVRSLVRQMQSLSIDVLTNLLLDQLRIFPFEISQTSGATLSVLLGAIQDEVHRATDTIFVDSLTPCIVNSTEGQIIRFFEQSKRVCSLGATVVTVIHSDAVDKELLIQIQSLCDAHLRLRTENNGTKLIKIMEVAKIRGASRNTGNIISFEVEPGIGMRIIPISKAQG